MEIFRYFLKHMPTFANNLHGFVNGFGFYIDRCDVPIVLSPRTLDARKFIH